MESWIDYNKQYSEKFKEWERRAKNTGEAEIHSSIMQAVRQMEEANNDLSKALIELQDRELL